MSEILVQLTGILACDGSHLSSEQSGDDSILVSRPDRAITSQERCAGALLACESDRSIHESIHEPLEADRCFLEWAAKSRRDAVDHAAAHYSLADTGGRRPVGTVIEQIRYRNCKIVIRIQQADAL